MKWNSEPIGALNAGADTEGGAVRQVQQPVGIGPLLRHRAPVPNRAE